MLSGLPQSLWPLNDWQCSCNNCDSNQSVEHVHVQLLSTECALPISQRWDHEGNSSMMDSACTTPNAHEWRDLASKGVPTTPRQQMLSDRLVLPVMELYPVPPGCNPHAQEDEKRRQLLEMYQAFALEMHRGMYLTQLMADLSYQDIHCQLMEDMATLKLDQSNGRIIEFPLSNVSNTYSLTKVAGKWYPADKSQQASPKSEHVVVVVFSKRKLAFVFQDQFACSRFMTCFELLIWRAHEVKDINSAPCPTPRLVRNSLSSLRPFPSSSSPTASQQEKKDNFQTLYQAQDVAEAEETEAGGRMRQAMHTPSMVQWPSPASRDCPQQSMDPLVPLNHVHDAVARLVDSSQQHLPLHGPVRPEVSADDETVTSDHTATGHSSSDSAAFRLHTQDPEEI